MSHHPPFQKPWLRCIGSDRLSTMLRQEYWDRLRQVRTVLPFEFIRCHGLFGDELGVVRRGLPGNPDGLFFNFSYLDQIFDTLLAHQVRPYLELGFMPEALASGPETVFWWKGNITPPRDWAEWNRLVETVFGHWIDRYGLEEVRRWPVEVWNEPNLAIFWKDANQEAYFRLYRETVSVIKAVDGQIRVGGPAICGGSDQWIDAFLGRVKAEDLPLDFFTRHLYSGEPPTDRNAEVFYQYLAPPEKPVEELRSVRQRIDAAGFPDLELHITEFNTSYHPLCPVHDTPYNAAHLAQLLSEAGDSVDLMSFWTFSDLFEEADVPRSFFHGGFGLLGREGIPKPTYHLFTFFAALGSEVLDRSAHWVVTARPGSVALVAWHPTRSRSEGGRTLEMSIPWTGGRPILIRRRRVHETAANPRGVWVNLGRPRFPGASTVAFLRDAAVPAVETSLLEPNAGRVTLTLDLEPNEITLVELSPFVDETPTYLGMDETKIDGYR